METHDIVIGFVPGDSNLVKYIKDGISNSGIEGVSVWHSGLSESTKDETAQALLRCKVFLPILSEASAEHPALKDQIALAYVSNKAIIPVATQYFRTIAKYLDGGLKLILAKINWIFFAKKEKYEENMGELLNVIQVHIKNETPPQEEDESQMGSLIRQNSVLNSNQKENSFDDEDNEGKMKNKLRHRETSLRSDFWDRHFETQSNVSWIEFRERFIEDYGERIVRNFSEKQKNWFVNLIYKDIFELRKTIDRSSYDNFTGPNTLADADFFYSRLRDYAIGYFAMREVFDMESSVRITAIRNLGSFQTPSVIITLYDLLADSDPNVRAVAGLALAKTGKKLRKTEDHLMKLLRDEDRLVRESACLSLAYMRCTRATAAIVDLWRNDPIKHVREAAELALDKMGGDEAEQAIKVTKVLTTEMANLRANKK